MTETTPIPAKKRLPWAKIILVLSLGFNLLIVGLVVGAKFGDDRRPGGNARSLGLGPYFSALSDVDKRAIGQSARQAAGPLRDSRKALRRQSQEFIAALRADPFDPSAIANLLAAQRQQVSGLQTQGQKLLLERIEAMTPEERSAYADQVVEALKRGPRKR